MYATWLPYASSTGSKAMSVLFKVFAVSLRKDFSPSISNVFEYLSRDGNSYQSQVTRVEKIIKSTMSMLPNSKVSEEKFTGSLQSADGEPFKDKHEQDHD